MSRYVVGASAAAEYLLRTSLGLKVANIIDGGFLLAPELLDDFIDPSILKEIEDSGFVKRLYGK